MRHGLHAPQKAGRRERDCYPTQFSEDNAAKNRRLCDRTSLDLNTAYGLTSLTEY